MNKVTNRLIVWTEDIHDILFLIIIEILRTRYQEIICILPRRKYNRLSSFNEIMDSKVSFFILNSPILIYNANKLSLTKILNKITVFMRLMDGHLDQTLHEFFNLIDRNFQYDLFVIEKPKVEYLLYKKFIYSSLNFNLKSILVHDLRSISEKDLFFEKHYYISETEKKLKDLSGIYLNNLDVFLSNINNIQIRQSQLKSLNKSKILRICVVGYVSSLNRDYMSLVNSIPASIKSRIQITFLGSVKDDSIILYYLKKGIKLKYFTEFISTKTIVDALIKSHFTIYSPSTNTSHLSESMSSTFIDSARYCIPVLSQVEVDSFKDSLNIYHSKNFNILLSKVYCDLINGSYNSLYGYPAINKASLKIELHDQSI